MSALEETLAYHLKAAGITGYEREVKLIPDRRFRFDFVFPERKIAVEVDGGEWVQGRHQRPAGFRRDAEKYSLAAINGWRVLRVTGSMVESGEALALVEKALAS